MIRRIAITGPESTGKSWLSENLAKHYNTAWVPEYAREYLGNLERPYRQKDILAIARGQLDSEKRILPGAERFLFCDTEFIVTRIWSEVKYGSCDPEIIRMIDEHRYDLWLLCDIDLPWEFDPLREHPGRREFLFDLYRRELESGNFPFRIVGGVGNKRLQNAIEVIENWKFPAAIDAGD